MRIVVGVEYNGHGFNGWQSQSNLPTIQGCLEMALSKIANEPVKLFCAGRTDAGVHALGQVAHFDSEANRDSRAWIFGTNAMLPSGIAVRWAKIVDENFHARFSAMARTYRYIIDNHLSRPAILFNRVTWRYEDLNLSTMQIAANYLIGENDFTSFRSSQCESKTPMRCINQISLFRQNDFVMIDIEANAFLHHMVRNIVGALIQVGIGHREPEWMQAVLNAKNRRLAAETAPAAGLYLLSVKYPDFYELPNKSTMSCHASMFLAGI